MTKKKSTCKCPPEVQRQCKGLKLGNVKDVSDIIEALTFEPECTKKFKKRVVKMPFAKPKTFKPRRLPIQDNMCPMSPPMQTRLQYIRHCPKEPFKPYPRQSFPGLEPEPSGSDIFPSNSKASKKVRYKDLVPADITMPLLKKSVHHTPDCIEMFNVPSPKLSGEVIQAQKAVIKSSEFRPPLPPKSAYELHKPHSGIIVNRDKDFVPEVANIPPGTSKIPQEKPKRKPCYEGGVCLREACNRKKCRYYVGLKKKRKGKKQTRLRQKTSYTTLGVTDGKPRAKGTQKHLKDDDSICGLDEIPRPEQVQIPMNLKRGTLQTHSLTVIPCTKDRKPDTHYGILTGSFNMYDTRFGGRSRGRQALTMSVMAYCLAFHYHPKQWTMRLIDNLVMAGDVWYIQCSDKVHDHSAVQGMCEVLPFGKKHTLLLNAKRMQVLLAEPDVVGYTMSLDPTVYNLCRGLKAFFKNNRAGVFLSRVLKVVIWRDRVCYYIFDPAGRDSKAYSNYASGCAALINVKDIKSLADILLARSILADQKFVLAPVKVLKMQDEKCDEDFESDKELTQAEKAMMGFKILNENCAIVNANMHLGDRCFEDAKYRQAIPIAVVAMTYSKISPPNTWFSKTLDKILRLGNKLYVDSLHPKVMIDITIDNIPNEIIIGPYACEIIIYRERIKGQLFTTKECLLNIRTGLAEFFSHEYNSGIIEFNNYALAIWRQRDMYYLFDPYARSTDGLRTFEAGKACCFMLLNPETLTDVFIKNWDYLPVTTQFYIHAFKVLKLKKREPKNQIVCTLSDEQMDGSKKKKRLLAASRARGDGKEIFHDVFPVEEVDQPVGKTLIDEEQLGDIVSLMDSIQEDYLPPIPLRYKNMPAEPLEEKIVNLDSPTVSVTQVVPPWPKPRDKTNEPPEPDPDPEPTPPPTPPPPPKPEGAEEEEEEEEDEDDEEYMEKKREEAARKKAEEEEARRKAEELPPPLPPPPPSPQPEPEVPLALPIEVEVPRNPDVEDEAQTTEPIIVDRQILLPEDAKYRSKLRSLRKKITPPLTEDQEELDPDEELLKPSNFKSLPDNSQIIRGTNAITDVKENDILPFAAIMAVVTSYKYMISTWTVGIVNFVLDTAKKLHDNKSMKFQLAPVHVIPRIAIGHQAYRCNVDVIAEGPTWQLEDIMSRKFLTKYDRGMLTTPTYSCAFFKRNGLYYLYDASTCNPMGMRDENKKGKACLLRFQSLHDLVARIWYNKDGQTEDQQFVLSRIVVRRLLTEPRLKLPEDYDFSTGLPKSKKSKFLIDEDKSVKKDKDEKPIPVEPKSQTVLGYQNINGTYRVEGTTSLKDAPVTSKDANDVKSCHFVCLIVMLMATMHPIRTWDHVMVDICIEKGLEIYEKAENLKVSDKRVIKNINVDGKLINVNIKRITMINENPDKRIEQYIWAVLGKLRYVIIRFPKDCSVVMCQADGYYHLFDPYPPNPKKSVCKKPAATPDELGNPVAGWTMFQSVDSLINRLMTYSEDIPEFYTFELASVKNAPRHAALNYRLSPLFKPDENPNTPFLIPKRSRPLVDEKMYWLNIESVPWSRMSPVNDLGFPRKTPKTLWKDWDIEFPGDLYSLWGSIHPMDVKFEESHRGKQYLAVSVVALAMTKVCSLGGWTGSFLDGIVNIGNNYHKKCAGKFGKNHEVSLDDLDSKCDDMYPYSFTVKFDKVIYGFIYNMRPDRFNLSRALNYFFEKYTLGILICPGKNLAFGKAGGASYFMYDCQSYGAPTFSPGQGVSYMLKCESLNRLIYCMIITLNVRRHEQQFNIFGVTITVTEKSK